MLNAVTNASLFRLSDLSDLTGQFGVSVKSDSVEQAQTFPFPDSVETHSGYVGCYLRVGKASIQNPAQWREVMDFKARAEEAGLTVVSSSYSLMLHLRFIHCSFIKHYYCFGCFPFQGHFRLECFRKQVPCPVFGRTGEHGPLPVFCKNT